MNLIGEKLLCRRTLRSHLMRPTDTVDLAKQDGLVYGIPYECGICIGETGRSMHQTTP